MKQSVLSSNFSTTITAILLVALLTITVTTSIQPVFAPRSCAGCIGDFQKLTGEFVVSVAKVIGDPNLSQGPAPHLTEFRKLTAQFERDVINAVISNPPEPDRIFGLLNSYDDGVERIFLGGPDTIPGLLQDYGRNVFQIFGLGPPKKQN